MALVNEEDLATLLGISLVSAAESIRAGELVDAATSVVEGYVGQGLESVQETVTLDSGGTGTLVLPVSGVPITIDSVTEDGTLLASTDYTLDAGSGLLRRTSGVWGSVVIVLTHGFTEIPGEVRLAVLIVARQLFESGQPQIATTPEGVTQRSYGQGPAGDWKELVDSYRQIAVA